MEVQACYRARGGEYLVFRSVDGLSHITGLKLSAAGSICKQISSQKVRGNEPLPNDKYICMSAASTIHFW